MATTPFNPLVNNWITSNRYTAVSDVDILIVNTGSSRSGFPVRWTITSSDTVPVLDVVDGGSVEAGQSFPMQLLPGERLWLAGSSGARASVID